MKALFAALLLSLAALPGPALDLWRYPEIAGKNALFAGALMELSFDGGFSFQAIPEIHLDWMLPVGLPFSAGLFFKLPDPGLENFGIRLAYHIDLNNPKLDLYLMYFFDFNFLFYGKLQPGLESRYVIIAVFRLGLRFQITRFLGVCVESGPRFRSFHLGLSAKLN